MMANGHPNQTSRLAIGTKVPVSFRRSLGGGGGDRFWVSRCSSNF